MGYKDKQKNREYQRLWSRRNTQKTSDKVFELLGNKCKDCGIMDSRVFQIDHIKPIKRDPNDKHKGIYSGTNIKKRLANGKLDPADFQILCANCHQIKSFEERKTNKNYIK